MSLNNVALIGATGNLGPAILSALLAADFRVTILSREGSTSTDSLASHPNQTIKKANFDDVSSLTTALTGIDAVISNVASHALLSQKLVIDAAIAAKVSRFLPSDFGSDLDNAVARGVPFNQPKVQIHEYLEGKAKEHPSFSYTNVTNGPFFDWCLAYGLFADLKNHSATLWDGGNTKTSTTTLASVGKTVVGVLKNPEATKNKTIRVADTTLSQKDIIEMVKEIDGKEWTTKPGSTEEAYNAGLEEMKKPQPDFMVVVMNQLMKILFSEDCEPDFSAKLDNEVVGLTPKTREEIVEILKKNL